MAGIPPADRALEVMCNIIQELSTKIACLAVCEDRLSLSDKIAEEVRSNGSYKTGKVVFLS